MKRRPEHTAIKPPKDHLYLDVGLLQSGDVLLELGTGKESARIARVTGGPFSHAALVVAPQFLFESQDDGIWYTPLKADRVERVEMSVSLRKICDVVPEGFWATGESKVNAD